LDLEGYHPARSQVEAILDATPPKNATQVRAYVGMLNHYGKFLPHFSRDLKPLFDLTSKGAEFVWTTACQEVFELSKKKLLSHQLLVPFDGNRKVLVSSDNASPYGVGCVIAHEFVETLPSGQTRVVEKPVAFASCTLSPAQQRYAQIERGVIGSAVCAPKILQVFVWSSL